MSVRAFKRGLTVRLALDSEAPAIRELLLKNYSPIADWLAFDRVHPHWLLALHEGVPVGAICLCYARPIAYVELLAIRPDLSGPQRGIVLRKLTDQSLAVMKLYPGCEAVAALIAFEDPGFTRIAKRNGWRRIAGGNLMLTRV